MIDVFETFAQPDHERWMREALKEARLAEAKEEVPIGCVVVHNGAVIGRGHNQTESLQDPTAHAEMIAITAAAASLGSRRLLDCSLYVTLEPCAMCAGAMSLARIARLVFAAEDPKGGAVLHGPLFFAQPTCHHRPQVARAGDAEAAGALLKEFFRARR